MLEHLRLLVGVLRAGLCARGDPVAEYLLLRQQLLVLRRPTRLRARLRARDKLFWLLTRLVRRDWRRHLGLVRPDTVVRWHHQGWKLSWRWKSRPRCGRPQLRQEVRDLIRRRSQENRLWGTERIRGELLKLGVAVGNGSIRRYRRRPAPRPPSQTWRTFLRNHAHGIWAADLFVVQTLTFKTPSVLRFISHGRRELVHLAVTAHPAAAWVWRQLVEASPWGRRPEYLVRDRDRAYGGDFRDRAKALGIKTILTPVRAPRANAIAERVIGTIRREYLDHVIPVDERHLRTIVVEFVDDYNQDRPHRTLRLETPQRSPRSRAGPLRLVHARSVPGGLHHVYEGAA